MKNVSASIRTRLLNLAKSTSRDFQELTIRYTVERFLVRLVESEHRDRFVLKGAMLFIPWKLDDQRTTMDLDLLGFGSPDVDHLKQVFQDICEVEIEDDGLSFQKESITATPIREEAIYDGIRILVRVTLGSMLIRLQVDVGFGDQIVPEPKNSEFPSLLSNSGPTVRSYPPETVIAEKFNAMVLLGMANSRMKDYFDVYMLSQNFEFEGEVIQESIQQTFLKRQTPFPQNEPLGLSEEFSTNELKKRQWQGFLRKQRREESVPDLIEVVNKVRQFLMPIFDCIIKDEALSAQWFPSSGWDEGE